MKKLLLLIACVCAVSINAMEPVAASGSFGQASGEDVVTTQVEVYTVSTIKEFKRFFNTEPDPNKVPNFEFGQLTPDNCQTVLKEATGQHQGLKVIADMNLLLKRQTAQEEIFYLGLLQTIKDKLETVIPADSIYDKEVSTFSDFQMFFKRQPDLCTIIKFKFNKLTSEEREKVFKEANGQHQGLEELTHMVVLSGQEIKQFKVTPEIILYLEMLKKITNSLALQLPTE
jgi:hypothetical protein